MQRDHPENKCPRTKHTVASISLAIPLWVATMIGSRLLFSRNIVPPGILSWLVAVVPMIFGALVLWSYIRYMRVLDDLWVRIYLRALAFSFGVSVLMLISYPILELAGAPKSNALVHGAFSLFVFFGAASYGAWRYR
jgi:hypothetical protein